MAERLEVLIESQAEIEQCRRLAAEISDPETAKRLLKLEAAVARSAPRVTAERIFVTVLVCHVGQ